MNQDNGDGFLEDIFAITKGWHVYLREQLGNSLVRIWLNSLSLAWSERREGKRSLIKLKVRRTSKLRKKGVEEWRRCK